MGEVVVSIVVPTYKEEMNIAALVARIDDTIKKIDLAYEIIVVDDNSDDGIDREIERLKDSNLPIRLITRKEPRDLSRSVLIGFENAKGKILICIDADLSHPPEAIEKMLQILKTGDCDIVLGSRYMPGGSTDDHWTVYRYINSKVAEAMARPFTKVSDPMSGFFAIPAEVFKRAKRLDPIGFKIALELIVKCRCSKIREIPINFRTRSKGRSKLTLTEQFKYLRHIYRLAKFKLRNR
jgi:dolichol-phosphate mannosyltransferase